MNSLMTQGNPKQENSVSKLVCFNANAVSTFQILKLGVTIQTQCQYAPFTIGVHSIAHRTNLAMQTLSNLPFKVSYTENLL